jgi:hypothetical protein
MGAPVITVANVVVGASARLADFVFLLNDFWSAPISVGYSAGKGSAGGILEPGDLQPGGGAVTFAPGRTTQTLRLPLPGGDPGEQGEPLCLNVFVPAGFELLLDRSYFYRHTPGRASGDQGRCGGAQDAEAALVGVRQATRICRLLTSDLPQLCG